MEKEKLIRKICLEANAFRYKEIEIVKGFGLDKNEIAIKVKQSEYLLLKSLSDKLVRLLK